MEEGSTNVKLPCYMPRRMPSNAVQLKSEVLGTDLFHARNRALTAESTRCCARHSRQASVRRRTAVLMHFDVPKARRAGGRWCCRQRTPTSSMVRFLSASHPVWALCTQELAAVTLAESSGRMFGEIKADEQIENASSQIAPSHPSPSAWQYAQPSGPWIMLPTSPSLPVLAYDPAIHGLYSCASADVPPLALQPYCCVPMPQQLDSPASLPSFEPSEPSSRQHHISSNTRSLTGKERNTNPEEVACTGALLTCALLYIALPRIA